MGRWVVPGVLGRLLAEAHPTRPLRGLRQYKLNPPVPEDFVRDVEEQCGFTLPQDYRRFITQVGDGGAGQGLYHR